MQGFKTTKDARKYQRNAFIKDVSASYGPSLVGIKDDCVDLLKLGYTLRPNMVDIAGEDGACKTVITLTGSIPVFISGQEYFVPLTIWLTSDYPRSAPPTFVSPLPGTMLDPELRCVADDGLVRIPYNMSWSNKCNLVQFVREMATAFGKSPPVYSCSPRVATQRVPSAKAQIPTFDMLFNPVCASPRMRARSALMSPHMSASRGPSSTETVKPGAPLRTMASPMSAASPRLAALRSPPALSSTPAR